MGTADQERAEVLCKAKLIRVTTNVSPHCRKVAVNEHVAPVLRGRTRVCGNHCRDDTATGTIPSACTVGSSTWRHAYCWQPLAGFVCVCVTPCSRDTCHVCVHATLSRIRRPRLRSTSGQDPYRPESSRLSSQLEVTGLP
eukprot:2130541-Prymnesium_polylepis.2